MQLIFRALAHIGMPAYIRHFFFGLLFTAFPAHYVATYQGPVPFPVYLLIAANTFLYPVARYGYLSVVEYVVGGNVLIWETWVFLFLKLVTMFVCWLFALPLAPLVIVWLLVGQWWSERGHNSASDREQ
jgi:hypothetical protein